jgi:hypothetical protein
MRRCVPREERLEILRKCDLAEYGGHYSHFRIQAKVWSSGFYWPEMHEDIKRYVALCPECQRIGNISQRNSMPLRYNLKIYLFDVWGQDFMGPFKNSHGFEYILVMVDYVSKWVEALLSLGFHGGVHCHDQEHDFPSFQYTENVDKRWRNSLHWEEFQKVLVQIGN